MFCMRNKKHIFLYALLTKGLKDADQTLWMPRQVCTFVFRINKIRFSCNEAHMQLFLRKGLYNQVYVKLNIYILKASL